MDVFWNDPLCDCGALQMSEKWAELVYKLTFGAFYTQFSVGENCVVEKNLGRCSRLVYGPMECYGL
jgi:hypothetical protein